MVSWPTQGVKERPMKANHLMRCITMMIFFFMCASSAQAGWANKQECLDEAQAAKLACTTQANSLHSQRIESCDDNFPGKDRGKKEYQLCIANADKFLVGLRNNCTADLKEFISLCKEYFTP